MRSRFLRLIIFQIVCWVIAANLYMEARVVGLEDMKRVNLIEPIRFVVAFSQATAAGLIIGIILGIADVLLAGSNIRKRTFGFLVLTKAIIYISIIVVVITAVYAVTDLLVDKQSLQQTERDLLAFFHQRFLLSIIIFSLFTSFMVSFLKQVNQKFGPGIMVPLIFGKYYKPKQEERIFMFLDLRSSTTYAEQIGHVRFSQMIQDCFYDLATQVEEFSAEIYQYVGDEAVLTWKMKSGLKNLNCIHCFFAFEDQLKSRAAYYSEQYGFVPEFKAGLNSGLVMVAEVGEIKKEIAYHGDVLNTAARIQAQCNSLGKDLLISEQLKNILPLSNDFALNSLGSSELKGKMEAVGIWSVERI